MKIYYRTSDIGYKKEKPYYITNENCLRNFLLKFCDINEVDLTILMDNVSDENVKKIESQVNLYKNNNLVKLEKINGGSGAKSFNIALDKALSEVKDDNEIIYFCENDYLHRNGSYGAMLDAFKLNPSFVTLYAHKDKFIPANKGGNPYIGDDGGEVTKVFLGKIAWMLTNSTTMTFACKFKTLKETESILRKHTTESYPRDFDMFLELRRNGYTLIQPVPPSWSTHGEEKWLGPLLKDKLDVDAWREEIV